MVVNNWDRARVATRVTSTDPVTGGDIDKDITLVNRVTMNTKFNYEPIHGLNEWNQGVIEKPPEFTFQIALPALSPFVRMFRAFHVSGAPFNLELKEVTARKPTPNGNYEYEYALLAEELKECRIETKEVTVLAGDVPMVVFNGMALRYTFNDDTKLPDNPTGQGTVQYPNGADFGSGVPLDNKLALFKEWVQ